MALITVKCAWCPKEIGKIEGGEEEAMVSHGVCPKCYEKQMAGIKELGLKLGKEKNVEKEKADNAEEKPIEPNFPIK